MTNDESRMRDEHLVKKGAVKKALDGLHGYDHSPNGMVEAKTGVGDYLYFEDIEAAIDALEPVPQSRRSEEKPEGKE